MRRIVTVVCGVLVALLAMYGFSVLYEKAVGAEVPRMSAEERHDDKCCSAAAWSNKKATKFAKGKLGSSKGVELPKKVRKLIRKELVPGKRFDDEPWWRYPFHATRCFVYLNHWGDCNQANEIKDRVLENTTKVSVGCGTQAIIGAFTFKKMGITKKGWWGAGLGTLSCLWGKVYDAIDW